MQLFMSQANCHVL